MAVGAEGFDLDSHGSKVAPPAVPMSRRRHDALLLKCLEEGER